MRCSTFPWNNRNSAPQENFYLPEKKLKQNLIHTACSNIAVALNFGQMKACNNTKCTKCEYQVNGKCLLHLEQVKDEVWKIAL